MNRYALQQRSGSDESGAFNSLRNVVIVMRTEFYILCSIEFYDHAFCKQGPTGDQHIAEWATLGKYIEINK